MLITENNRDGPMSYNEGRVIVESHRELGDQWTIIAKRLPGRFRASVKSF